MRNVRHGHGDQPEADNATDNPQDQEPGTALIVRGCYLPA